MRRWMLPAAGSVLSIGIAVAQAQAETLDDFLGLWEPSDGSCRWIQEVVEAEAPYLSIERDMVDPDDYNCPVTFEIPTTGSGQAEDNTGSAKRTRLEFSLTKGVLRDRGGRAFKRCYDETAYDAKTCEFELESVTTQIDSEAEYWMEAVGGGDPATACDRHQTYRRPSRTLIAAGDSSAGGIKAEMAGQESAQPPTATSTRKSARRARRSSSRGEDRHRPAGRRLQGDLLHAAFGQIDPHARAVIALTSSPSTRPWRRRCG